MQAAEDGWTLGGSLTHSPYPSYHKPLTRTGGKGCGRCAIGFDMLPKQSRGEMRASAASCRGANLGNSFQGALGLVAKPELDRQQIHVLLTGCLSQLHSHTAFVNRLPAKMTGIRAALLSMQLVIDMTGKGGRCGCWAVLDSRKTTKELGVSSRY